MIPPVLLWHTTLWLVDVLISTGIPPILRQLASYRSTASASCVPWLLLRPEFADVRLRFYFLPRVHRRDTRPCTTNGWHPRIVGSNPCFAETDHTRRTGSGQWWFAMLSDHRDLEFGLLFREGRWRFSTANRVDRPSRAAQRREDCHGCNYAGQTAHAHRRIGRSIQRLVACGPGSNRPVGGRLPPALAPLTTSAFSM